MSTHLLDDVDDLIKQATKERSHYYTGKVLREVRVTLVNMAEDIVRLRKLLAASLCEKHQRNAEENLDNPEAVANCLACLLVEGVGHTERLEAENKELLKEKGEAWREKLSELGRKLGLEA